MKKQIELTCQNVITCDKRVKLTNSNGETYTTDNQEFMDFICGAKQSNYSELLKVCIQAEKRHKGGHSEIGNALRTAISNALNNE